MEVRIRHNKAVVVIRQARHVQRLVDVLKRHVHALFRRVVEDLLVHGVVHGDALREEGLDGVEGIKGGGVHGGQGCVAVQLEVLERYEREFGEENGLQAEGLHVAECGVEDFSLGGESARGIGGFGLCGVEDVDCAFGNGAEGRDGGAVEAVSHGVCGCHIGGFVGLCGCLSSGICCDCNVVNFGEGTTVRRAEVFKVFKVTQVRYLSPRSATAFFGATRGRPSIYSFDAFRWSCG
jgi:hypothetical protein